ncbi:MAG: riboflavin synthase [Planctomycetes bacterium]|nr:riboflavin synthase [Planctomycetota bacterium]
MFAGVVEKLGTVVAQRPLPADSETGMATRLEIELGDLLHDLEPGASVAVNGVCLTLAARRSTVGSFDVVPETWKTSNLAHLALGESVNLERALRFGERIDGHFVQGHVDGVGTVDHIDRAQGEWRLWVACNDELMPYIVRKGSIALDGVSLTITDVGQRCFAVALIPTTLERTTLGRRNSGARVNIETDILARLVVNRLDALVGAGRLAVAGSGGITWETLREGGYLP